MRIKFTAPDPRAGTIAQMDSSRGQHFIEIGAAVPVNEDGSDTPGADSENAGAGNKQPFAAAAVKAKTRKAK